MILFRHRKRRDRFFLQKNEEGELAISLKAMEQMVRKCLESHEELDIQRIDLENRKDGMLVRVRGKAAGGISIPLTVESLQRQIRQYVTACSGIEILSIRVEIDESGQEATDAPFIIEAPSAHPLLKESGEKRLPVHTPEPKQEKTVTETDDAAETELTASASDPVNHPEQPDEPETLDDDDDRPLHQRLFSTVQEPCIVPAPPQPQSDEMHIHEEVREMVSETEAENALAVASAEGADGYTEESAEHDATNGSSYFNQEAVSKDGTETAFSEAVQAFDRFVKENGKEDEHELV